ncbi:hypothetical protein OPT61_g5771 [Boeremia exigua]|uniref:Uncharacterized protein n=1 Tax=Boeremia exigua TaxID=749465 RepID=A0ACC2I957_9PLEO|nr:hypothetical protein OPT61_g5771 [Boeremia exigua]
MADHSTPFHGIGGVKIKPAFDKPVKHRSLGHRSQELMRGWGHIPTIQRAASLTTATLGLSLLYTGSNANLIERQDLSPPATLPTGWSYKGCYTDAVGQRTLQGASFADGSQDAEECIAFCDDAGYSVAGTEYSSECYCGNAIADTGGPAPNGEGCNMACSGAPGEACGGPNRLSVYERTATPPAPSAPVVDDGSAYIWVALGCYSDLTYARILSQAVGVQGGGQNNTAQSCTDECRKQNFQYAGTEYSSECYCGNTLNNGHTPANDGCNMKCTGNNRQICGGPDRINIYEYVPRPTSTSSSSLVSTSSSTQSSTPTVESSTITASSSVVESSSSEPPSSTTSSPDVTESSSSISSASSTSSTSEAQTTSSESSSSDEVSSTSTDNDAPTATSAETNSASTTESQTSSSASDISSASNSTATSTYFNSTTSDQASATLTFTNTTSTEVQTTSTASLSSNLSSTATATDFSSTSFSLNATSTASESDVSASSASLNVTATVSLAQNTTTSMPDSATVTELGSDSSTSFVTLNTTTSAPFEQNTTTSTLDATITGTASESSTSFISSNATTTAPFAQNTTSSELPTDSSTLVVSLNTTTTAPFAQNTTTSVPANITATETASDLSTPSASLNATVTASFAQNTSTSMSPNTTIAETTSDLSTSLNATATAFDTLSNTSSIVPTPTPEPKLGWQYEGCYVDGAGGRSLPNGVGVQGQMTNEKCRDTCRAAGFVLAGTEYAGECYCGNKLVAGGAPAPDGEAQCNMACNGNQTEICGGPNRLSLWRFYLGNEPPPSSTTVSSSSATPIPTGLPEGFEYKGCYVDGPGYRVMDNQQPNDDQMTVASCSSRCVGLGYDVAGMEYHTQCFCDTMLRMGAYLADNDNECNTPCGGDPTQTCGGGDRLSVYSNQTTLKIIKKAAPIQTVGNWTYQGCATDTALDWNKPIPWKLANETGNSPEWCLNRCAQYGYMVGGMEYGSECYCGDLDHMVASGSQPAPESDCNTPCPGNPEAICGQGNRLTWYKYTEGDPLYVFSYPQGADAGLYEFLVGGPVIPLISQPLVTGKVSFLEKHGTGPNGTGAYEFDPSIGEGTDIFHAFREMDGLKTDVFCAASLTLPDRAGRVINVGGWSTDSLFGVRLYWPDGQLGTNGTHDWQENFQELSLQTTRWYPTSLIMPNGSVLVVGGENGSNGPPVPNMEILPTVGPLKHAQYLLDTDPYNLYPFLAVLPSGGILIQYYNEARILDERSLDTIKILPKAPATVNDDNGGRTYPLEGTMVLLPQVAPYSEPLEILVCGGAGIAPAWGIDNCVTTQPDLPNPEWTIERMPSRRVLTCMVTLPDGTFLILNGAEEGAAGFGLASKSNFNAVLYDPSKPKHNRMSIMANTTIARMYHSEAVLMDDGRVLVSGSDPEDETHPQEYRLEVFKPPYLLSGKPRPSFTIDNTDWMNGASYPFTVTGGSNIQVSLLGSEASTHGNSMGARALFPAVSCGGSACTVTAPPGPYVAPPGWYRMFVLSDGVPSPATWVRIGGDPARLGEWPNLPDFQPLPGVGPVKDLNTPPATTARTGGQKFRA